MVPFPALIGGPGHLPEAVDTRRSHVRLVCPAAADPSIAWVVGLGRGRVMQVRLLGPVDVAVDGVSRPVRGLRRKSVLAVLALHRGEVVGTDRLINVVWG